LSEGDVDAALETAAADGSASADPQTGEEAAASAVATAAPLAEDTPAAAADADRSVQNVELPDFGGDVGGASTALQSIDLLNDVRLRVRIELGRTRMYVEDVLRLGEGSVVELDKLAGDPVDVFVNDRLVARGEVLVLNDNFCVRVSEIIADEDERIAY
jgi:flagellar motor switch protein FliN/FliY